MNSNETAFYFTVSMLYEILVMKSLLFFFKWELFGCSVGCCAVSWPHSQRAGRLGNEKWV